MADEDVPTGQSLKYGQYFDEKTKFEDIIDKIGSNGRFQMRMNVIFNFVTLTLSAMSAFATLIALTVPPHWCHVPGRETTNMTMEMWKSLTIPRDERGYSKCLMKTPGNENVTMSCTHEWEYDDTWFSSTAASQANWVCDKRMYSNKLYSISRFASIPFGVMLFYCGDRFGRKKQFLLSITVIAISRTLLTVSAGVYPLYVALSALSEAPGMPCIESTTAIGIELAGMKHRSYVNFLAIASYCIGSIGMGLIAWTLRNWVHFVLAASVPCFIPLLLHRYLPESPRWLLSKGRPDEALKILERVAATNGKPLPPDTTMKLKFLCHQRTPNMGIINILTNRNLFKNTILLVISRSASSLVIFTLLMNSRSFGENPFIVYIAQGILKFFAGYAVHIIGNRIGRRITHCFILLTAAAVCVVLVFLTANTFPQWMLTTASLLLQFCASSSLSLTNLQSIEIHPTCIRQIAIAIEYVVVQCVMCSPPYLAYMGATSGLYYMFGVLAVVTLATSILMSFLPESLNEKLPETLKDASTYGCDQKFWSLPRRRPSISERDTLYKYDFEK
ncbi:solute carrier family 22 member 7-like isoform X2 [Schistocerca gregaria]|uniref:solute carrier family 22 member 7-like isoform X2 n=1 Tax=Schistocerca gregaria TaxID=7010 RepID=UPI00211DECC7|nr:solute carrier family 22 member 7-like isoform X2 [Schistocerca gregaria]